MQVNETNQADSIELFRQGKPGAAKSIFNQLQPGLVCYAMKFVGEKHPAEDIVSEAFLKIWERRGKFKSFSVLKSYLYTTVRNDSINWLKANQRSQVARVSWMYSEPSEQSQFEWLVEADTLQRLQTAMEQLSPQSRKIIEMTFFLGKKGAVIAQELGISHSTVKTQKQRGLEKLRKVLATGLSVLIAGAVIVNVDGLC